MGTSNIFLRDLFSDKSIHVDKTKDGKTITRAKSVSRTPTVNRTKRLDYIDASKEFMLGKIHEEFKELLTALDNTQSWFIYHINPARWKTKKPDISTVEDQITAFDLIHLAKTVPSKYPIKFHQSEFISAFQCLEPNHHETSCLAFLKALGLTDESFRVGKSLVFLSIPAWMSLEDRKTLLSLEPNSPSLPPTSAYEPTMIEDDLVSHYDSVIDFPNDTDCNDALKTDMKHVDPKPVQIKQKAPMTPLRRNWLIFVWTTTFCFPWFILKWCGLKTSDRQIAWREKVALCIIIFFMNAFVLFCIAGVGYLICPTTNVMSPGEISQLASLSFEPTVFMYGNYYTLSAGLINNHINAGYGGQIQSWEAITLGQEVTQMFPRAAYWSTYCPAFGKPHDPILSQFGSVDDRLQGNGVWMLHENNEFPNLQGMIKGSVVWDSGTMDDYQTSMNGRKFVVLFDKVYDLGGYYNAMNDGYNSNNASFFFGSYVNSVLQILGVADPGVDLSSKFAVLSPTELNSILTCMNGLFYVGMVDHRNDLKCRIQGNVLLAAAIVLMTTIVFKFFAALNFSGKNEPEDHQKFVICQVPCYTEVNHGFSHSGRMLTFENVEVIGSFELR